MSYSPKVQDDSHFIEGDATQMSLNDEEFDLAISLDVLEHIPRRKRRKFLKELYRIGKHGCILSSPFDKEWNTKLFEKLANEYYKIIYGKDYTWLKEHIKKGIPLLEETLRILGGFNKNVQVFPNAYLPHWQFMINIQTVFNSNTLASNYLTLINKFYNENFYEFDNQEPCYRYLLVVLKSECKLQCPPVSEDHNLESNSRILHEMVSNLKESIILRGNRILLQEHRRVQEEIQKVRENNQRLQKVNEEIQDEIKRVRGNNQRLQEDKQRVQEENHQLKREYHQLKNKFPWKIITLLRKHS